MRARAYIASFVLQFYEGVGVLLHRKLIDIDLVDDLLHNSQKVIWEKVKGIMEEARKRYFPSERSTYPYFEYLYNEMQKREQRLQQTQQ